MDEKQLLLEKYHLKHEVNGWYSERENSHKHLIFKDSFYERNDVLGLLFRVNKLCMGKLKYFRANIDKFEPMRYSYRNGFIRVSLWDADFFRHKASGYILDFRYLQTITCYEDFMALCEELESFESDSELSALIPKDKFDVSGIEKLMTLSDEEIEPLIPGLLEWLVDGNHPAAEPVAKVLSKHWDILPKYILPILLPGQTDEQWKWYILSMLGRDLGFAPDHELIAEIKRISDSPTDSELSEEVNEQAIDAIERLGI